MSELFNRFASCLDVVFTLNNLLYCFLSALLGTFVGVLPDLGPLVMIALLLPFTFFTRSQRCADYVSGDLLWFSLWWLDHVYFTQYSR
ncbi:MAG: tripartite tricarboxylate transporter permease [Candidatus Malihini olakiniferum]